MADTLYLDEPFSSGTIAFDYTPPDWNEVDSWWWSIADGDPPTNYLRARMFSSVGVTDGQLLFDAEGVDGNGIAMFSVSGGTGNNGFGDNCPVATQHFISADVTFDVDQLSGGYFSVGHNNGFPHAILLEILSTGEIIFLGTNHTQGDLFWDHSVHQNGFVDLAALGKVTVRLEWQYATSAGGDNVNNDGWARLWIGTSLIYDLVDLPIRFYSRPDFYGQTRNTFNTAVIGYWGPFAPLFDNLKVGTGIYEPDDAQYARPIADVDAGAWTPSSGVTLYPMVNDVTPDDGTFIRSPNNPVNAECELTLNDVEPFGTNEGDIVITIRGTFDDT